MKHYGNENTQLVLSDKAEKYYAACDSIDIFEYERTVYRVSSAHWEDWGPDYTGEDLTESEIWDLLDNWGLSWEDVSAQLEEITQYRYTVYDCGYLQRSMISADEVNEYMEDMYTQITSAE